MSLDKGTKEEITKKFQLHEKDTGSADVQIAILTERIAELTEHLKIAPKDHSSRLALLKLVGQRRKLLDYLNSTDTKRYQNVWKLEELERALARDIKEVDFVESNARTKFLSIKLTVPHYDKKFNDVLAKVATETKKYGIAIAYAGMQQYLPYPDEDKVFHDYFIQETQLLTILLRR